MVTRYRAVVLMPWPWYPPLSNIGRLWSQCNRIR